MDYEFHEPVEAEVIPFRYHDRQLIVPASDELGRTAELKCVVPPDISVLVGKIVESGETPWHKKSDAMRWFVVEGLRKLHSLFPHLLHDFRRVEAMIEYLNSEKRRQDHVRMVDKMEETIKGYLDWGAEGEARRVISNIAERIREWEGEENSWVREETVRRMSKYLHLFKDRNPFEGYKNV